MKLGRLHGQRQHQLHQAANFRNAPGSQRRRPRGASKETNVCYRCTDERCCDAYSACATSPACNDYKACWKDCVTQQGDDAGCEIGCAHVFPDGVTLFAPYFACMRVECAVEQTNCDEAGRTACQRCIWETCAAAYVAFLVDPFGFQLVSCIEDCPIDDVVCDQGCYDAFPTAYPAWGAYADCVAAQCTEC